MCAMFLRTLETDLLQINAGSLKKNNNVSDKMCAKSGMESV